MGGDVTVLLLMVMLPMVSTSKNCPIIKSNHVDHSETDTHEFSDRALERKLQLHLLQYSHPMIRPVYDSNDPVVVTFGFSLTQVGQILLTKYGNFYE